MTETQRVHVVEQRHVTSMIVGLKSPHNRRGDTNLPERLRNLSEGKTTRPTPNTALAAIYHKQLTAEDAGKERGLSADSVHLGYFRHIKGIDENLGRLLDTLDQLKLTDDTQLMNDLLAKAAKGDARAQADVAVRYRDGKGVAKDEAEAMKWAHRAADSGDADAMDFVGFAYLRGAVLPTQPNPKYDPAAKARGGKKKTPAK